MRNSKLSDHTTNCSYKKFLIQKIKNEICFAQFRTLCYRKNETAEQVYKNTIKSNLYIKKGRKCIAYPNSIMTKIKLINNIYVSLIFSVLHIDCIQKVS